MKQLQFNQMENVSGGYESPVECVALATHVMIATIETGIGSLFAGLATYSLCSLLS